MRFGLARGAYPVPAIFMTVCIPGFRKAHGRLVTTKVDLRRGGGVGLNARFLSRLHDP